MVFFFSLCSLCLVSGTVYSSQFVTYDGQTYVYNCPGEFILSDVRTSAFSFSAQILVDALSSSSQSVETTGVSAISLTYSLSATVQLEATSSGTFRILVNGIDRSSVIMQLVAGGLTSLQDCLQWGLSCVRGVVNQPFSHSLPPGIDPNTRISIIVNSASSCRIVFTSGISIDVSLHASLPTLILSVSLPQRYRGQTISGLLGNCDGNTANEFVYQGQVLPTPLSLGDAFYRWCRQCKYC